MTERFVFVYGLGVLFDGFFPIKFRFVVVFLQMILFSRSYISSSYISSIFHFSVQEGPKAYQEISRIIQKNLTRP